MRLKDKVAIIAGAGQSDPDVVGNGRATALTFAREGAKLMLANRSEPSLEETARQIRAEGHTVETTLADITNEADCRELISETKDAFGQIDILHNNVGSGIIEGDTTEIDLSEWRASLDRNLTGAMLLSKHALPSMRAQQAGCIIHTSSIASIGAYPLIAYKVAKAALNEFCRWLAYENGPYGIRCNSLMLGLMDTPTALACINVPLVHPTMRFAASATFYPVLATWAIPGTQPTQPFSWPPTKALMSLAPPFLWMAD